MAEENYIELVTKHIELDKLLGTSDPKYHDKIKKLLDKKEQIKKSNGLFAEQKINKINKKLEKFKNTKKEEEK